MSSIIFVGQGPNQKAWERGIRRGDEEHSMKLCKRLAVTGAIGRKLADLGGFPFSIRFNGYDRANLNSRWNGKSGKGDKFCKREATIAADAILAMPYKHHVLLGREVGACFGIHGEFLEVKFDPILEKDFLLFPHPSGINPWWNDSFNAFRARKRLKEYLKND